MNITDFDGSPELTRARSLGADVVKIPNFKDFKRLKHVDDIRELYNLTTMLGQGQFGKVFKGKRKVNNSDCAIKCIYKDKI